MICDQWVGESDAVKLLPTLRSPKAAFKPAMMEPMIIILIPQSPYPQITSHAI